MEDEDLILLEADRAELDRIMGEMQDAGRSQEEMDRITAKFTQRFGQPADPEPEYVLARTKRDELDGIMQEMRAAGRTQEEMDRITRKFTERYGDRVKKKDEPDSESPGQYTDFRSFSNAVAEANNIHDEVVEEHEQVLPNLTKLQRTLLGPSLWAASAFRGGLKDPINYIKQGVRAHKEAYKELGTQAYQAADGIFAAPHIDKSRFTGKKRLSVFEDDIEVKWDEGVARFASNVAGTTTFLAASLFETIATDKEKAVLESLTPEQRLRATNFAVQSQLLGTPLMGMFDNDLLDISKNYYLKANKIGEKVTEYNTTLASDLAEGRFDQATVRVAADLAGNAPQLMGMLGLNAVAPGLGTVMMGTNTATDKMLETVLVEDEQFVNNKIVNAWVHGIAEAGTEMITQGIADDMFKTIMRSGQGNLAVDMLNKMLVNIPEEGLSEGAAAFIQGMSDHLIGEDNATVEGGKLLIDGQPVIGPLSLGREIAAFYTQNPEKLKELTNEITHSVIVGGAMGGVFAGAGPIGASVRRAIVARDRAGEVENAPSTIESLMSEENIEKYFPNPEELAQYNKAIESPTTGEEVREALQEKVDMLEDQRDEAIDKELDQLRGIAPAEVFELMQMQREVDRLKRSIKQLRQISDMDLDPEVKAQEEAEMMESLVKIREEKERRRKEIKRAAAERSGVEIPDDIDDIPDNRLEQTVRRGLDMLKDADVLDAYDNPVYREEAMKAYREALPQGAKAAEKAMFDKLTELKDQGPQLQRDNDAVRKAVDKATGKDKSAIAKLTQKETINKRATPVDKQLQGRRREKVSPKVKADQKTPRTYEAKDFQVEYDKEAFKTSTDKFGTLIGDKRNKQFRQYHNLPPADHAKTEAAYARYKEDLKKKISSSPPQHLREIEYHHAQLVDDPNIRAILNEATKYGDGIGFITLSGNHKRMNKPNGYFSGAVQAFTLQGEPMGSVSFSIEYDGQGKVNYVQISGSGTENKHRRKGVGSTLYIAVFNLGGGHPVATNSLSPYSAAIRLALEKAGVFKNTRGARREAKNINRRMPRPAEYRHFSSFAEAVDQVAETLVEQDFVTQDQVEVMLENRSRYNQGDPFFNMWQQMVREGVPNIPNIHWRGGMWLSPSVRKQAGRDPGKGLDGEPLWQSVEKGPDSANFKRWFGDWEKDPGGENVSKVVDQKGMPLIVHHGTTKEIEEFDRERSDVESYMGDGHYFSSSEEDVHYNYAGGGPDRDNKIDRRVDELMHEDPELDREQAVAMAEEEFGTDYHLMAVYLDIKNPFIVDKGRGTWLDFGTEPDADVMDDLRDDAWEEIKEDEGVKDSKRKRYEDEINERAEELYDEHGYRFDDEDTGLLAEFADAFREIAINEFEQDASDVDFLLANLLDQAREGMGISAAELVNFIRIRGFDDNISNERGQMVAMNIFNRALEAIRFDGIIDKDAGDRFKFMDGVYPDTVHYIVWDSGQVKSTLNRGTYRGKNILKQADGLSVNKARIKVKVKPRLTEKAQELADNTAAAADANLKWDKVAERYDEVWVQVRQTMEGGQIAIDLMGQHKEVGVQPLGTVIYNVDRDGNFEGVTFSTSYEPSGMKAEGREPGTGWGIGGALYAGIANTYPDAALSGAVSGVVKDLLDKGLIPEINRVLVPKDFDPPMLQDAVQKEIAPESAEDIDRAIRDIFGLAGERGDITAELAKAMLEANAAQQGKTLKELLKSLRFRKTTPAQLRREIERRRGKSITDKQGPTSAPSMQSIPASRSKALRDKVKEANKLFNDGVSLEEIYKETGLFMDRLASENSWRWFYRIDPNQLIVKKDLPKGFENRERVFRPPMITLGELIDYPEFFEAYPEAKGLEVHFGFNRSKGSFYPNRSALLARGKKRRKGQALHLSDRIPLDSKELKYILVHELQHYVQHYDTWQNLTSSLKDIWDLLVGNTFPSHNMTPIERSARMAHLAVKHPNMSPYELMALDAEQKNLQPLDVERKVQHMRGRMRGPLYSVAGRKAASYNYWLREVFQQAHQMLVEGKTLAHVKRATGVEVGVDGKLRYEIDDSRMKVKQVDIAIAKPKGNEQTRTRRIPLEDLIEHDALFAIYPFLKQGVEVEFVFDPNQNNPWTAEMEYDRASGKDVLGINIAGTGMGFTEGKRKMHADSRKLSESIKEALLHELTHVIQAYEDFNRGGNLLALKEAIRFLIKNPRAKTVQTPYGEMTRAEIVKAVGPLPLPDDIDPMNVGGKKANDRVVDFAWRMYTQLAGEYEARRVAERRNLSPEERMRTLIFEGDGENLIVTFPQDRPGDRENRMDNLQRMEQSPNRMDQEALRYIRNSRKVAKRMWAESPEKANEAYNAYRQMMKDRLQEGIETDATKYTEVINRWFDKTIDEETRPRQGQAVREILDHAAAQTDVVEFFVLQTDEWWSDRVSPLHGRDSAGMDAEERIAHAKAIRAEQAERGSSTYYIRGYDKDLNALMDITYDTYFHPSNGIITDVVITDIRLHEDVLDPENYGLAIEDVLQGALLGIQGLSSWVEINVAMPPLTLEIPMHVRHTWDALDKKIKAMKDSGELNSEAWWGDAPLYQEGKRPVRPPMPKRIPLPLTTANEVLLMLRRQGDNFIPSEVNISDHILYAQDGVQNNPELFKRMMFYQWFDVHPAAKYPLHSIEVHMETTEEGFVNPRAPFKFDSWGALQTHLMDLQGRVEKHGGAGARVMLVIRWNTPSGPEWSMKEVIVRPRPLPELDVKPNKDLANIEDLKLAARDIASGNAELDFFPSEGQKGVQALGELGIGLWLGINQEAVLRGERRGDWGDQVQAIARNNFPERIVDVHKARKLYGIHLDGDAFGAGAESVVFKSDDGLWVYKVVSMGNRGQVIDADPQDYIETLMYYNNEFPETASEVVGIIAPGDKQMLQGPAWPQQGPWKTNILNNGALLVRQRLVEDRTTEGQKMSIRGNMLDKEERLRKLVKEKYPGWDRKEHGLNPRIVKPLPNGDKLVLILSDLLVNSGNFVVNPDFEYGWTAIDGDVIPVMLVRKDGTVLYPQDDDLSINEQLAAHKELLDIVEQHRRDTRINYHEPDPLFQRDDVGGRYDDTQWPEGQYEPFSSITDVKDTAREIQRGTKHVEVYGREVEKERRNIGEPAIAATLHLRGVRERDAQKGVQKTDQEKSLGQFLKDSPEYVISRDKFFKEMVDPDMEFTPGGESRVFLPKGQNGKVIKLTTMRGRNIIKFLEEFVLWNYLSPTTPRKMLGFIKIRNRWFAVQEQPLIGVTGAQGMPSAYLSHVNRDEVEMFKNWIADLYGGEVHRNGQVIINVPLANGDKLTVELHDLKRQNLSKDMNGAIHMIDAELLYTEIIPAGQQSTNRLDRFMFRRDMQRYNQLIDQVSGMGGVRSTSTGPLWQTDPVIHTDNFKKWFGDWKNDPDNASKIVTSNGAPKVMYHGTDTPGIEEFKYSGWEGATFFTTSQDVADTYAEESGYTMPVYLNVRSPLVIEFYGGNWNHTGNVINEGPLKGESIAGFQVAKIKRLAQEHGHDGVIFKDIQDSADDDMNKVSNVVLIFGKGQIKSVNNHGNWDPNDNNIYFQADSNPGFTSPILQHLLTLETDHQETVAGWMRIFNADRSMRLEARELDLQRVMFNTLTGLPKARRRLTVPKRIIMNHILMNSIQIEETYADSKQLGDDQSRYVTKGGENYREILLTLPLDGIVHEDADWQERNVVVHAKLVDREIDGKKILSVEEIDSEWARQLVEEQDVPNMPYADMRDWSGLILRRLLQLAVNEGYDQLQVVGAEEFARRRGNPEYKGLYNQLVPTQLQKAAKAYDPDVKVRQEDAKLGPIYGVNVPDHNMWPMPFNHHRGFKTKAEARRAIKLYLDQVLPMMQLMPGFKDRLAMIATLEKLFTITEQVKPGERRTIIDITDKMVAGLENRAVPLYQTERGAMWWEQGDDGMIRWLIYALTDPNVTTPLHELVHLWEKTAMTPEQKAKIMEWAGHDTWTVETSELLARGFERYLAEGKAPTPALQHLFDKFAQWLYDIYRGIVGSEIDIELSPKIKDIYAQMLGIPAHQVGQMRARPKNQQEKEGTETPDDLWKDYQRQIERDDDIEDMDEDIDDLFHHDFSGKKGFDSTVDVVKPFPFDNPTDNPEDGAKRAYEEVKARNQNRQRIGPSLDTDAIEKTDPKKLTAIIQAVAEALSFTVGLGAKGQTGLYDPSTLEGRLKQASNLNELGRIVGRVLDDRYNIWPEIMRSGNAEMLMQELQYLAHVSGKVPAANAKKKNADDRREVIVQEGLSEFFRALLVNPRELRNRVPNLMEFMDEFLDPDVRQALTEAQAEYNSFIEASARDQILANVDTFRADKNLYERFREWYRNTRELMFPSRTDLNTAPKWGYGRGLKGLARKWWWNLQANWTNPYKFANEAFEWARENLGKKVLPKDDFTITARLFAGFNRRIHKMWEEGIEINGRKMLDSNGSIMNVDYLFAAVKRFFGDKKPTIKRMNTVMNDVVAYMVAERTIEYGHKFILSEYNEKKANWRGVAQNFAGTDPQLARRLQGMANAVNRKTARIRGTDPVIHDEQMPSLALAQELVENANKELYQAIKEKFFDSTDLTGIGGGIKSDMHVAAEHITDLEKESQDYQNMIRESARRYREMADAGLRYAVEKGRLSEEQYQAIKDTNHYYVNLTRNMEMMPFEEAVNAAANRSGNLTSVKEILHRAKGGTQRIKNPFNSMMTGLTQILKESDRNEIIRSWVDALTQAREMYGDDAADLAELLVPAKEGDPQTLRVIRDGKVEHWQVKDKFVYRSIKAMAEDWQMGYGWRLLTAPNKLLKFAITNFPLFAQANFIRDTVNRPLISKFWGSNPLDVLNPKNAENLDDFELYGGSQAGFHHTHPEAYLALLEGKMRKLSKTGALLVDIRDLGTAWKGYKRLLEKAENANRIAEFGRAKKHAQEKLGYDEYNANLYAAFHGRDLLDFAVAGHMMKWINQYIPFSNALVQGTKKGVQAAYRNPIKFAATVSFYTMIPTILVQYMAMLYDYEDEYEELPVWQRDLFWNFKLPGHNAWVAIPKPFELGSFSTVLDRSISYQKGYKNAYKDMGFSLFTMYMPYEGLDIIYGPFKPIGEVLNNRDNFRKRDIVPRHEKNKAIWRRKGIKNASQLSQDLASVWGLFDDPQMDPRQIDHIIKGYTAYMGNVAIKLGDLGKEDSRHKFSVKRSSFGVVRDTQPGSYRSVTRMYELAADMNLLNHTAIKRVRNDIQRYYTLDKASEKEKLAKDIRERAANYVVKLEAELERREAADRRAIAQ